MSNQTQIKLDLFNTFHAKQQYKVLNYTMKLQQYRKKCNIRKNNIGYKRPGVAQ